MTRIPSLLAACWTACFFASAVRGQSAPPGPERTMTLADAVAITLRSDLAIRDAAESVEERRGIWLEESGNFDRRIMIEGSFTFDSQELIGSRLEEEEFRRLRLEIFSDVLDDTAQQLIDEVNGEGDGGTLLFQECRPDQDRIILRLPDGTVVILCRNVRETTIQAVSGANPQNISLLFNDALREALGDDIEGSFFDRFRIISRILRLIASTLRLQRERLGDTPDEIQFLELDVLLGYQLRFRDGNSLTASISFNSTEENFADKPLTPSFGDSPVPNTFTTAAGVQVDFPLGKGRGKVATAAPERAAEANLRATEQLLLHTASQRALDVVNAYWRLAAAEERLQWLDRSSETQEDLLELTNQLVDADELTRSELSRTQARHAQVLSEQAAARRDVVTARLELVRAMGLTARRLEHSPKAADGLPDGDRGLGAPQLWVSEAYARRHDLMAVTQTTRANDVLAQAAKANLRHQVDLSLNASYNGLYETFENRLYEIDGFLSAWEGKVAGPSYGFGLRWVVPVKNSAACGRLLQAEASRNRSWIMENDLKRSIRLRILELCSSIEQAQKELVHQREALRQQQRALDNSLELYKAGELTLIDTLLTEEQLTDTRLALVEVKRRIAELEAQLQFESGQLLQGGDAAGDPDVTQLRLTLLTPPTASSP